MHSQSPLTSDALKKGDVLFVQRQQLCIDLFTACSLSTAGLATISAVQAAPVSLSSVTDVADSLPSQVLTTEVLDHEDKDTTFIMHPCRHNPLCSPMMLALPRLVMDSP